MTIFGWLQIALVLIAVLLLAKPLGLYMARVFSGERTWLSPVLVPVETGFYRLAGVRPDKGQGWLGYALGVLTFSLAGLLALYAMLRLQDLLPLNPQGFAGLVPDLAFNTAVGSTPSLRAKSVLLTSCRRRAATSRCSNRRSSICSTTRARMQAKGP